MMYIEGSCTSEDILRDHAPVRLYILKDHAPVRLILTLHLHHVVPHASHPMPREQYHHPVHHQTPLQPHVLNQLSTFRSCSQVLIVEQPDPHKQHNVCWYDRHSINYNAGSFGQYWSPCGSRSRTSRSSTASKCQTSKCWPVCTASATIGPATHH